MTSVQNSPTCTSSATCEGMGATMTVSVGSPCDSPLSAITPKGTECSMTEEAQASVVNDGSACWVGEEKSTTTTTDTVHDTHTLTLPHHPPTTALTGSTHAGHG